MLRSKKNPRQRQQRDVVTVEGEDDGTIYRGYDWIPLTQRSTKPWCPPEGCPQVRNSDKPFLLPDSKFIVYDPESADCVPTILANPYDCSYTESDLTCSVKNIPNTTLSGMLFDYPNCSSAYSNEARCPPISNYEGLGGDLNGFRTCAVENMITIPRVSCAVCNDCGGQSNMATSTNAI